MTLGSLTLLPTNFCTTTFWYPKFGSPLPLAHSHHGILLSGLRSKMVGIISELELVVVKEIFGQLYLLPLGPEKALPEYQ